MNTNRRTFAAFAAGLVAIVGTALAASIAGAGDRGRLTTVDGTIWVANRGADTIRGFDASTGDVVRTVAMRSGSQPGDLAYARGKLYVAEEFGTPPAIAIVDAETGEIVKRLFTAAGSRPHHVHASPGRDLVAFGLYGTDKVAVVDTRTDMLLGPWDTNPDPSATSGRAHAGVFSTDGRTLYVASDASNEVVALEPRTGRVIWRMPAVGAHELVVAPDGRTAYLSRRTANVLSEVDLERRTYKDVATLGLPDTLRFATLQRRLTVGLRTSPAQLAVVNPLTFDVDLVNIGPVTDTGTIAGHQWTSSDGRYTFAAFEGGSNPGVAVIDHRRSEHRVVRTLAYPGRPHGVDLAPAVDLELETEDG